MKLNVNGQEHDLAGIDRNMPLLWVLRDKLNLTGTKYGCGRAQCGACTVHINGQAVRSCSVSATSRRGKEDRHHRGGLRAALRTLFVQPGKGSM